MKIQVKVKTGAREDTINKDGEIFKIKIKKHPINGKANEYLTKLLAEYFNCSKSSIELISGHKSRNKVFQINN